MFAFTVTRLIQMIVVLWAVSVIVFLMMTFTGDPVFMVVPIDATQAEIDQARRILGLDRPMIIADPPAFALHRWNGRELVTHFDNADEHVMLAKYDENMQPLVRSQLAERPG